MNQNMTFNNYEKKIVSYLKKVLENQAPEGTVLRIAGGYVRDKLLGLNSHDIDIAINNMSGQEFANLVIKQLDEDGLKHDNIHVISARPDQSKHLETAEFNLFGTIIDFVNLRKENYAESRIPSIEPGSPEEDAFRRDLTINALFYNINEDKIEDLTNKGLNDLSYGICRTPINPLQTFIDDPLRVLRTIRFAAKFHFQLDNELIKAAKNKDVHDAFSNKISRERVWTEMVGQETPHGWKHGFLTGPNPPYALRLLKEIRFRDLLFRPQSEANMTPWDTDQNNPNHDLDIWNHTMSSFKYLFVNSLSEDGISYKFNEEDIAVRNLAMILHDIGKCCLDYRQEAPEGHYTYKKHELGSVEKSEEILDKLNAPIHIKQRVLRLVGEHMRLHLLPDDATDRSLRRFLRDLEEDWSHSVDIAIADAHGKKMAIGNPDILPRYESFRSRIKELLENQGNQIKVERPINGHDLINVLGMKPGPEMGRVFKILDEALLENPNMERMEALKLVKENL